MGTYTKQIPGYENLQGSELLILEAAFTAFLKFGYYGTTIQMIAELAQRSHSSVHYYFRSKDNIFELVFCRYMEFLLNSITDYDFINKKVTLVQKNVNYPELLSIAWFVANELRSNSRLIIEILRRNEELRVKISSVYKTPEFVENFRFLINSELHEIIEYILLNEATGYR